MVQAVKRGFPIAKARDRHWTVNVRFVFDEAAMGQVFLRVIRFHSVNITSPKLHTLHLHVAIARRTNGRIVGDV